MLRAHRLGSLNIEITMWGMHMNTDTVLPSSGVLASLQVLRRTFGVGVRRLHCRLLKPSSAASTERCERSAVLVLLAILLRAINHTEQAGGETVVSSPERQDARLSAS